MTEKVHSLAVIDLETTGVGNNDRVVEIAAVILDPVTLATIDEFDTLINPLRDVGPTRIHGITPSMVSAAPTFEEIVHHVSSLLTGSVLVAHNLSFDQRFLTNEFQRVGGTLEPGTGLCTLKATRVRLDVACRTMGIELDNAHRALADARACADVLRQLTNAGLRLSGLPATAKVLNPSGPVRTLRRDALGHRDLPLQLPPYRFAFPSSHEAELSYLYMLDRYLDDGQLTPEEMQDLSRLAEFNGIAHKASELRTAYFNAVYDAAKRDDVITSDENDFLVRISKALGVPYEASTPPAKTVTPLPMGQRVCFTGEAEVNGRYMPREELATRALLHGFVPVDTVTKKGCDLLVAADVSTMSGKAKKAAGWGIPILSVEEFMKSLDLL